MRYACYIITYCTILVLLSNCVVSPSDDATTPAEPISNNASYLSFDVLSGEINSITRDENFLLSIYTPVPGDSPEELTLQPHAQYQNLDEAFSNDRIFQGYLWSATSTFIGLLGSINNLHLYVGYPSEDLNIFISDDSKRVEGNYLVCSIRQSNFKNNKHLLFFPARIDNTRAVYSRQNWGWQAPVATRFNLYKERLDIGVFSKLSHLSGYWSGNGSEKHEWIIRDEESNPIMSGRLMLENFFYVQSHITNDFYVGLRMSNTGSLLKNNLLSQYNGMIILGSGEVQLIEITITTNTLTINTLTINQGRGSNYPLNHTAQINGGNVFNKVTNNAFAPGYGVYKNDRFTLLALPLNPTSILLATDSVAQADQEKTPWIGIGTAVL